MRFNRCKMVSDDQTNTEIEPLVANRSISALRESCYPLCVEPSIDASAIRGIAEHAVAT